MKTLLELVKTLAEAVHAVQGENPGIAYALSGSNLEHSLLLVRRESARLVSLAESHANKADLLSQIAVVEGALQNGTAIGLLSIEERDRMLQLLDQITETADKEH